MPHTPGPWQAVVGSIGGPTIKSGEGSSTRFIANVRANFIRMDIGAVGPWALEDCGEESAANARLISAAPDLLEALRGVLRVADRATVEFDAARAAIKKAEES